MAPPLTQSFGQTRTRGDTWQLVLEILREIGVPAIVEQTGFSRSAVYAVINGAKPHPEHARIYTELTVGHARAQLAQWNLKPGRFEAQLLGQYRKERDERGENVKRCEWCGRPIPPDRRRDASFHSDRCRRAAARADAQASDG